MDSLPDIIAEWPTWSHYLIAGLVALATFLELGGRLMRLPSLVRWIMAKLFPPRDNWEADCPRDNDNYLDPNIAWNGSLGSRWSQMREMRKDDYFLLDIKKPRTINRIRFDVKHDRERFPKRFSLEIAREKFSTWVKIGEYDCLDIRLRNIKLSALRVTIIEPTIEPKGVAGTPAWSIFDVCLTQVHLWGLLRKDI